MDKVTVPRTLLAPLQVYKQLSMAQVYEVRSYGREYHPTLVYTSNTDLVLASFHDEEREPTTENALEGALKKLQGEQGLGHSCVVVARSAPKLFGSEAWPPRVERASKRDSR